jgi:POT family proton-dependent oligopeptide transporter
MVVGLGLYLRARRWLAPEPPVRRASGAPRTPLGPNDVRNVAILVALLPVLAVAQVAGSQDGNAYLIWAEQNLQMTAFGFKVPVTWLATLDAIGSSSSIILSLLFWRWWSRRRAEPDEMSKMAIGAVLSVAAPLFLVGASLVVAATGQRASLGWAVVWELVLNLGFANLGPIGLALYARLAPKGAAATLCGVFYLQFFLGNMLAGWLGSYLGRMSGASFWLLHAALAGGAAVILLLVRGFVGRAFIAEPPAALAAPAAAPAAPA